MKHIHRIFAAAATLAGAVLMLTAAPAAFAMRVPPPDEQGGGAPAPAYIAAAGGMHGWQIALIAVGAALVAATAAVLLDRTWVAHKARSRTA